MTSALLNHPLPRPRCRRRRRCRLPRHDLCPRESEPIPASRHSNHSRERAGNTTQTKHKAAGDLRRGSIAVGSVY